MEENLGEDDIYERDLEGVGCKPMLYGALVGVSRYIQIISFR